MIPVVRPFLPALRFRPLMVVVVGVASIVGALVAAGQGRPAARIEAPRMSIADAKIREGNAGTRGLRFFVHLAKRSSSEASVKYVTVRGAADSSDYNGRAGILRLPAGRTLTSITIPITGDRLFEKDETFTVELSQPVGATLARARATGTILNDD